MPETRTQMREDEKMSYLWNFLAYVMHLYS